MTPDTPEKPETSEAVIDSPLSDDPMSDDPLFDIRERVLTAALPDIAFDGWTDAVLALAGDQCGVSADEMVVALPKGALDLLTHFSASGDAAAYAQLQALPRPPKIRQAIALAVKTRIEVHAAHREAVRRAMAVLALPGRQLLATKLTYQTVDMIWRWVGDQSTDYNFYTKRAILSGVLTATRFYWLSDESDNAADSWAFLDRRIENVMQFEKLKAAAHNPIEKGVQATHAIISRLAQWRYGRHADGHRDSHAEG